MENHVGGTEQLDGPHRQEGGIAGPSPNQCDASAAHSPLPGGVAAPPLSAARRYPWLNVGS